VPDNAADARALRRSEARTALWRLFVAAFCAMQIMMLATPAYVSAQQLRPGDQVRVPVGEGFAADGVLLQGDSAADEALLTGESRPVPKSVGDAVAAGSLNLQAPVLMRVDRVGADTRYEGIVALMRAARHQRPAMLASADRWAAPFLWTVLLLAAVAGAVWSVIEPSRAVWVVVSVLIVTCPCALSLAAPSALLAAAGAMGRRGLLLRRLDAIAGLAAMQTLFIDKTGTLTDGRLCCVEVQRLDEGNSLPTAQLQGIAASLAGWSQHPLSLALRQSFAAADIRWRGVTEQAGLGLEAIDAEGRRWRLGRAAWTDSAEQITNKRSVTCLSCDGVPLARFVFDERLRDDAPAAVQALQRDGVQLQLLSGDEPSRVQRIAELLGLDAASGAMTPEAKLAALRRAQLQGQRVAMIGDGINDAPVLAQADVSIAMGEGAQLARAQADGVLVSNRLGDLVQARALSRRALRVVRQNMAWAALYNAACVPLALAGWLPPWAAGLGMAASSLFVVLNATRLAR
jgi:Cu2+-exporting ATPase